jgi:ABC-type lipoprotein export system ATPase subunit
VIRLFREQHEAGKTVILVTHERRLANVASRRVRMLDGRIQAGDGPLTEEESVAAGPLPGAPQEEDILS